ncbi:Membrane protein YdfJ [Actinomadura rubteroloni]|uniref:Membrane protein YdfJ n=1 Tax=Actinomadura rubteroloni TaxID=1926885 RepID=A0A2P4UIL7_9ACTN|nr:MMPL family transporter [Actinomadura rubteroloni]POM24893.1 Membrane protein YdfJ [Actinomadura rubteroloni]
MSALARWCLRHRVLVVLLWVAALVGLGTASQLAGTKTNDSFSLPGTESTKAMNLLLRSMPAQSGASASVVWQADGDVRSPDVANHMKSALAGLARMDGIAGMTSPYTPQGARQISADGHVAYASFTFAQQAQNLDDAAVQKFVDAARAARADGLRVEAGGNAVSAVERGSPGSSEIVGIVAAAVVLFIAFGSLMAMLLPIGTAIAGVGTGLMTVTLLTHVLDIGQIGPILGALIGLGVGIDYALFIVTRHRANLKAGMDVRESVVKAVETSGRAVLFAGGTVVIALLGLFVLGMSFLNGMAVASATTVVCTVLASVTLLPALLGLLGRRVLSRRERRRPAGHGTGRGVWARWAGVVERRPVVLSVLAVALIAVLSLPVLSLRLGSSDAGNDPASSTTRKAYDMLADGFGPGFNGPLQLVAETPAPSDRAALEGLAAKLEGNKDVAAVNVLPAKPGAALGIVQVVPKTSPQSKDTADLITHLRDHEIPAAERGTTLQVYVGGPTAIFDDFAGVITGKLPLFLGVIVALGFVLLLVAFRSVLVPLTAAVMNVIAAAASFGVVVAFFQYGWGSDPLGLGAAGPVEAFLPVIMLSILFGLSMDYQVFLVSRMHEEWVHTRDNRRAIAVGQAETGRVITAAATIMIAVFTAFAFGGQRVIGEFGIGLAAAVALDAFILRTVLVPAVMHLFGRANWWLPGWLDRILPRVSVEGPSEADEPERLRPVGV